MQDRWGTHFDTPDGKAPATSGVPITVYTPQGPKPGYWDGSNANASK